jgi:hypothetical protein
VQLTHTTAKHTSILYNFGCETLSVMVDFSFNCCYMEIPLDNLIHYDQCVSTIMHKAFDWKRSRISMLEVEAIPKSCIP